MESNISDMSDEDKALKQTGDIIAAFANEAATHFNYRENPKTPTPTPGWPSKKEEIPLW